MLWAKDDYLTCCSPVYSCTSSHNRHNQANNSRYTMIIHYILFVLPSRAIGHHDHLLPPYPPYLSYSLINVHYSIRCDDAICLISRGIVPTVWQCWILWRRSRWSLRRLKWWLEAPHKLNIYYITYVYVRTVTYSLLFFFIYYIIYNYYIKLYSHECQWVYRI